MTVRQGNLGVKTSCFLILVAFLWGSAFFQIKIAVTSLTPEMVAFVRVAIAFIAVLIWCVLTKKLPANWRKTLLVSAPLGIFGMALPFFFQNSAEQEIASSHMAVIMATVPLLTLLISAATGQAIRSFTPMLAGVTVGFIGIWLLLFGTQAKGHAELGIFHLFALAAAFSYALNFVVAKHVRDISLQEMTLGALTWAVLLMGVLSIWTGQWIDEVPALKIWAALIGLGLGSTAGACYLTFSLVRTAGPQAVSLAVYLVPVFGLILGRVFLAEPITPTDVLATLLILGGIWLTTALRNVRPWWAVKSAIK